MPWTGARAGSIHLLPTGLDRPDRMGLVFITGAHGFIGRHLARTLSGAGHTVAGLGHGAWPESEALAAGVSHWINGDIVPANLHLLQRACGGTPEHVVHLAGGSSVGAAVANPREDFFRTVATTAELLDWMRSDAPTSNLIAVSSAAVYGAGHVGAIVEDAPLNPFSPYGHHKRMMEDLCRSYAASYGLRVCVARLFSVYGEGLTKQLLWDLCSRLAAGNRPLTLGGLGDELRDWTDVRDVCRALQCLLEQASTTAPVFNVGSGQGVTVREVAGAVAAAWAAATQEPERAELVFSGISRTGDPFSLVAAPQRLSSLDFDWQVGLREGLARYVEWFLRYKRRSAP